MSERLKLLPNYFIIYISQVVTRTVYHARIIYDQTHVYKRISVLFRRYCLLEGLETPNCVIQKKTECG